MRARPASLALHGALLAVLVAGPVAYVSAGKTVRLIVDGVAEDLRTYAGSVGQLLDQQGIRLGSHDTVSPGVTGSVLAGMQVDLRHGRRVDLMVDGVGQVVWTTAATVAGLLDQLGSRFQQASVSSSRFALIPRRGMALQVHTARSVRVNYGGVPTVLVTTAVTWSQALTAAGLPVGSARVLSVPAWSVPSPGQLVWVWLTGSRLVQRLVRIPSRTLTRLDPTRDVGTRTLVQAGAAGAWRETWRYTLRNGAVVAAHLVDRRLQANPVPTVIAVGTRPRAVSPRSTGYPRTSVNQLNWSALARCESGGNPRAVGGGGLYLGLYQFRLSTWQGLGGRGSPLDASVAEQTYRAQLLYLRAGAAAWPYCGRFL